MTTRNPAALQAELAQRLGDLLAVVAAPATSVGSSSATSTSVPAVSGDTAAGAAARLLSAARATSSRPASSTSVRGLDQARAG